MKESSPRFALILPAYCEVDSLPYLVKQILEHFDERLAFLIVDDSPLDIAKASKRACEEVVAGKSTLFHYHIRAKKLGRGSAVRYGLELMYTNFPTIRYFAEADTDGSHQAKDIVNVLKASEAIDVVIGSRYLPKSQIIGWAYYRRILSKTLNQLIPTLLNIPTTDITNGLRRYSRSAVDTLLSYQPKNSGFIFLSEQLVHLHANQHSVQEIPITFVERTYGRSSVTPQLLLSSLFGLLQVQRMTRNSKCR